MSSYEIFKKTLDNTTFLRLQSDIMNTELRTQLKHSYAYWFYFSPPA